MSRPSAASGPAEHPLPAAVRARVVGYAAQALSSLPADDVPAPLRAVARFAPQKRARTAANVLAAALASDPVFRQQVAALARQGQPELAASVETGEPPGAADPVEVAALSYLLRQPGWEALVEQAMADLSDADRAAGLLETQAEVARLTRDLDDLRAQSRLELEQARAAAAADAAALALARRRVREVEAELRAVRASADQAVAAAEQAVADLRGAQDAGTAENRRLRARLADAEAAVEAGRRAARAGRSAESVRLRLLLDTVVEAAAGLRRELALPPADSRPADAVEGLGAQAMGVGDLPSRARTADDPAWLDHLLALPMVHLIVDGYNVTKTGYGTLTLAEQRTRLLAGLAALAARTRAEVTCVFDGTTLEGRVVAAAPRGVRVRFSPEGETADELIRRLVRAEPEGRPLVVVSSDREVADGVERSGARAVPAAMLLRRLERS